MDYMKILIKRNILHIDPNKEIKLIYYNKFKTSDLVINNSSLSIGALQKSNVIYQFKCTLGDCISENNNICVGLTSNTLSRRLTVHLSDTSSIAQHIKENIPVPKLSFEKFLPKTILEQNTSKNYRFSKHSISERNYLNSTESISNPVLMNVNVFSYCCYL